MDSNEIIYTFIIIYSYLYAEVDHSFFHFKLTINLFGAGKYWIDFMFVGVFFQNKTNFRRK